MKYIQPSYEILTTPDSNEVLKFLERCGRTCYKSESKIVQDSAEKFVRMLIDKGHESVIEHYHISVKFIADRGFTHELVRHRLASFSQESTRYCNYAQDCFEQEITVIPFSDGLSIDQDLRRRALYRHIEDVYLAEIEEGVSPQQARDNLPTCLKSEIIITTNLRHWREILRQRTSKAAHPRMRQLMTSLLLDFQKLVPVIFDDIQVEKEQLKNG